MANYCFALTYPRARSVQSPGVLPGLFWYGRDHSIDAAAFAAEKRATRGSSASAPNPGTMVAGTYCGGRREG
jgi:hypothetical protein